MCLCCFMVNFLVYSSIKCSELNITKYHQKFLSWCRVSSNLTLLFTLSTSLPYLIIAYASCSILSLQILPLIRLFHSLFLLIHDCYHYFLFVRLPFFIICLNSVLYIASSLQITFLLSAPSLDDFLIISPFYYQRSDVVYLSHLRIFMLFSFHNDDTVPFPIS